MVELVKVVLAREDGAVGEHLGQDASHGPDVDGLCVALGVEHNLRALYHLVAKYLVRKPVWSCSGSATLARPKLRTAGNVGKKDNI